MKTVGTIIIESSIVGLSLIAFVYIASFILSFVVSKPSLPEICATWNKNYIMEITLFVAGFLFHSVFEYTGLNKKYVDAYYK